MTVASPTLPRDSESTHNGPKQSIGMYLTLLLGAALGLTPYCKKIHRALLPGIIQMPRHRQVWSRKLSSPQRR